ncbi:helix-turn-helix domain-containing protein [Streptomyces sp. NPDC006879]|uniref:helix-turn-helix domain-containing protein n=1 Tax=Streptomyces sp. NPDC006879 TaxID=3364767 RepID=UPI0036B7BA57
MTGQPDEVGRFAEHLRELKDRTGNSYGVLAGRLHIGRSTLHRYCLGETIPSDYAVVDRLARLAGASREELIELHRRWVLADEARMRAATPRAPVAQGTASQATGGTSGSAACGPHSSDAGPHLSQAAPQTDQEAAPDARPRPSATGPQRAPSEHADPNGPGALVDSRSQSPHPDLTWDGPMSSQAPSRRPRKSRRRILTASAAVVLTVGAAVTANRLAGGVDQRSVNRPGPAPNSSASAARPTGPTMATDAHVWNNGCEHSYLVDRRPSVVPPPPVQQDAGAWMGSLGAVDGGRTIVQATISAPKDGDAVVQELTVRVVNRRPSLNWSAFAMSSGCGGKLTPARYAVDLDAPRPLARPENGGTVDDAGKSLTIPAPHLPYRVAEDDPLVLRVEATAVGCDCDWYLEAQWTSGDRRGTLRIDDSGRPFRTSGTGTGKSYYYARDSEGWAAY